MADNNTDNMTAHPQKMADELTTLELQLSNYEELLSDQFDDDPSYVARGNGFCDSKYSSDFLENQIENLRQRISQLKNNPNDPSL